MNFQRRMHVFICLSMKKQRLISRILVLCTVIIKLDCGGWLLSETSLTKTQGVRERCLSYELRYSTFIPYDLCFYYQQFSTHFKNQQMGTGKQLVLSFIPNEHESHINLNTTNFFWIRATMFI